MRLRVTDPTLVPELLKFLHPPLDVVAEQVSENEVSLSLLGTSSPMRCRTLIIANGRPGGALDYTVTTT